MFGNAKSQFFLEFLNVTNATCRFVDLCQSTGANMENYLRYCVQELFNKIKTAEFTIPDDGRVSEDTRNVIRRLLVTDPAKRLTATQVRMQGHQGRDPSPAGHRPGQAAHRHTGTHARSPGT